MTPPPTPPFLPPEAQPFLADIGWERAPARPIAGDASGRRYLRLQRRRARAVLMCAPADAALEAFLRLTPWLREGGLAAPAILAARPEAGLVLLQDLGARSLSDALRSRPDRARSLHALAGAWIAAFQALPPPPGPPLVPQTPALFAAQLEPLADYAPGLTPAPLAEALVAALEEAGLSATVPVHRDLHSANLIWRPGRPGLGRLGVIDYQDALRGDPAYDLASLLRDARRDVPTPILRATLFAHARAGGAPVGEGRVRLLALARNLRILGLFARLAREGRPGYLVHMPRLWRMLAEDAAIAAPALAPLIRAHLPPPTPVHLAALAAPRAAPRTRGAA